jgi:hypothetical protein
MAEWGQTRMGIDSDHPWKAVEGRFGRLLAGESMQWEHITNKCAMGNCKFTSQLVVGV